jgi:hypothetical protein
MAISFILILISGILKFPGFISVDEPVLYLILTDLHDFNGIVLTIVVVIHVSLHIKWILKTTKKIIAHKSRSKIFNNHGLNRHLVKYLTSIGLLISSILVGFTGILKYPGILIGLGQYYQLSGIFTVIHDWSGVVMGILVLIHLVLNWRWMVGFTKRIIKRNKGIRDLLIISSLSLLITTVIPVGYNMVNINYVNSTRAISIENVGTYDFNNNEIPTIRPDIFKEGHFSIFDTLIYLDVNEQIDMDYHFDSSMNTYVIDSINDTENWWYRAYYDGGWLENNVFRLDHYPYKPGMRIFLYQESLAEITRIYDSFKVEIDRLNNNNGSIIIPLVKIDTQGSKMFFHDVNVAAHNLRDDFFQNGVITAIDIIMSLGDQGLITYEMNWYDYIGTAEVNTYFIESINGKAASGRCGFVYETGDSDFSWIDGNHIHIPSDIRVIDSPEYAEWFYICI